MENLKLITCVVDRGKANKIVKEILKMRVDGVTIFYARGTGVRQKLGFFRRAFVNPEKEVFMTVVPAEKMEEIFARIIELANLKETAKGFVFVQDVEKAFGFFKRD